jgi:hypothetical protein
MRRLICGAVVAAFALMAVPAAVAQMGPPPPDGWSFTATLNMKKVTLSNQHLIVNLSGTYQCTATVDEFGNDSYGFPIDPNSSNFGGGVTEIVGKQVISTGFGLNEPPICDGLVHTWTAQVGPGMTQDGQPYLWKSGKMIVQVGGGINDMGGNGVGYGNQWAVQVTG